MALKNPAFANNRIFASQSGAGYADAQQAAPSVSQLDDMYNRPSTRPTTEFMTMENSLAKVGICFAILLAGAIISYIYPSPILIYGGMVVGLVLGFVNAFKRTPSPTLILIYAAAEGLFLGGISLVFETIYPGIVLQATIATLAVTAVTLALFVSGKIRASARATKVYIIAMIGYLLYMVVNWILMAFGAIHNPFGLDSVKVFGIPLGIIIGIVVVIMAAYSLVLDFEFIKNGVANRAPALYGWSGAFGVLMSVIWLYLQILRILALARSNN